MIEALIRSQQPIIMVGHSMGGLVIKKVSADRMIFARRQLVSSY